jgi:hypothetical protein
MLGSIHWALWLTAGGTIATAGILLGSAIFALWQIRESVNTRSAGLLADLSRRWDEPLLRSARFAIGRRDQREIAHIARRMWVGSATTEIERTYYEMTPLPNFIEALSVIEHDVSGISLRLVDRLWGGTILGAWEKWRLAILLIRRHSDNPTSYENFESLVARLEAHRNPEIQPRYGLVLR